MPMQKIDKKTKRISRLSEKELLISSWSHLKELTEEVHSLKYKISLYSKQHTCLLNALHKQTKLLEVVVAMYKLHPVQIKFRPAERIDTHAAPVPKMEQGRSVDLAGKGSPILGTLKGRADALPFYEKEAKERMKHEGNTYGKIAIGELGAARDFAASDFESVRAKMPLQKGKASEFAASGLNLQ